MKRGCFIVLEGIDGCGKDTQIPLLAQALEARGWSVVCVREPGGTPLGERIRDILKGKDGIEFGILAEFFLFCAARAENVEKLIAPAMKAGKIALVNRFALSSDVYQGKIGGIRLSLIRQATDIAVQGIYPDLTIVLDIGLETRAKRKAQLDRIERRSQDDLERIRQEYLFLARQDPKIVVVDARGAIEKVHQLILKEVERVL